MNLKNKAISFFKAFGFRAALEIFHPDLIKLCREALKDITPEDIVGFVKDGRSLPIPQAAFKNLTGLEDLMEQISPQEIFELIYEAREDLANKLIELDDEGVAYVIKFRRFIIDSTKKAGESIAEKGEEENREEEKPEPQPKKKKVTCEECGASWEMTEEEASELKECPNCGTPA